MIKTKKETSAFTFVSVTALAFVLMISYVWLNNEVTSNLNKISSINKERSHAVTSINLLKAEIASLSRADRITGVARERLNMVFPTPEPVKLAMKISYKRVNPY